jgi:hypothetical protein
MSYAAGTNEISLDGSLDDRTRLVSLGERLKDYHFDNLIVTYLVVSPFRFLKRIELLERDASMKRSIPSPCACFW